MSPADLQKALRDAQSVQASSEAEVQQLQAHCDLLAEMHHEMRARTGHGGSLGTPRSDALLAALCRIEFDLRGERQQVELAARTVRFWQERIAEATACGVAA